MQIPFLNYFLAMSIVFFGLSAGILLAKIAEEELIQFKRWISFFKEYSGYKYAKIRQSTAAILFFASSYNVNAFIFVSCMIFLYFTKIGVAYYDDRIKAKRRKDRFRHLSVLRNNLLFIISSLILYLARQLFTQILF